MIETKLRELIPNSIPTVIGDLPSTATNIVALMLYDGGTNDEYFGKDTVYHPVVKCVIRHASYETMRLWSDQLKNALHQHHDDYFMSIHIVGTPSYLGRGPAKLHEMQCVFRLEVKE